MPPHIVAVATSAKHSFSKSPALQITLIAGEGVAGDAHAGRTVKHRSRVAKDPSQPNLRQVHLMHAELFDELAQKGFNITPGALGENVTTKGIDLLALPRGALLKIGETAVIRVTGLRNPCSQLDKFAPGLMAATLGRDANGGLIRKAGIMGIVLTGGTITHGDAIKIEAPPGAPQRLEPV